MQKLLPSLTRWQHQSAYQCRTICSTTVCLKNIRAGTPKTTHNRSKPLTYEEANYPYTIGVKKSWNSWNTSNLHDETERTAETTIEDVFIRKFVTGTWHSFFLSDIIVKRRQNTIIIAGLVSRQPLPRKMYFLQGYTEELLSHLFKRPVKMEIQSVQDEKDMIFKWI